ncbi:MAG: universal stress protein [Halobacteriales archaeon]
MYDHILLPTDGSDGTADAVDQAFGLAKAYDATVHALYVIDLKEVNAIEHTFDTTEYVELFREEGESILGDLQTRAEDVGVDLVPVIEKGLPHEVILEYSDDEGMDLIVMGTHGRTGLDRYLVGSVTEKVVRLADVPVLTTRLTSE